MELREVASPGLDSPGTLGEVLYASKGGVRVEERDWVALVTAIAAGDAGALHGLYDRSHRLVYALASRITGDRETAEEVTLDVFHDVWRRAASYDPVNGTVLGWIMNQARSRAIDRLRYERRAKRQEPGFAPGFEEEEVLDPAELLALRQRGEAVRAALGILSPDERQAIECAFFSGLTHEETARRLKEPLGTVKTRIRSGLRKLRQAIGNP